MKRRTLCGILAGLTLGIASPLSGQDELAMRGEHFWGMPELFESFSFSLGELARLSPPDPAYTDLVVPTIEGRLRIGLQHTFQHQTHLRQTDAQQAMRRVDERLQQATYLYLGLLAAQHMGDMISGENILAADLTTSRAKYADFGGFVPRGYMAVLASNLLKDEGYYGYFCNGDTNCEAQYRQWYRFGAQMEGSRAASWARGADEFASRTAIEAFLEKDAATLVTWSETLSHEVALVDMVEVPEYDFDAGGYALRLNLPRAGGPRANDYHFYPHFRADAPTNVATEDQFAVSTFLPLGGSEAQALSAELAERRPNNRPGVIYYVLKGSMIDIAANMPDVRTTAHYWAYELTSATVLLYKDAALEELIAELPLVTN